MSDMQSTIIEKSPYYNPDAPPEEALNKKFRKVMIRFKTREDLDDFIAKTGIVLNPSVKIVPFLEISSIDTFM